MSLDKPKPCMLCGGPCYSVKRNGICKACTKKGKFAGLNRNYNWADKKPLYRYDGNKRIKVKK
jgi:hypothetical protein